MTKPLLVIGNCNYSSWSLRAFMALSHAGIHFDLKRLPLDTVEFKQEMAHLGGSGKVPLLVTREGVIWESLAICEYAAEQNPGLWPREPFVRAEARAVACEMHAGFGALRSALPMNIRARRRVEMTAPLAADLVRLFSLWEHCRQRAMSLGPWLYGRFSVADAMFAPVASRLATYGIECPPLVAAYRDTVLSDDHFAQWQQMALAESEIVTADEAGEEITD